jgi:hypothetical protein
MSTPERDGVSEAELLELFRRRRPDADEFRAGVERRLRERAQEQGARQNEPRNLRAESVRKAAALVALDPAGPGATPFALGKMLSAALLVPFLLVALHVVSFLAGARELRRSIGTSLPVRSEPKTSAVRVSEGSRSLKLGALLVGLLQTGGALFVLLPALGGQSWAMDALALLFVVAAAGLVLSVRGFAESGWLTPKQVTGLVTTLLIALFAGVFLWIGPLNVPDSDSAFGFGASAGVVLAGTLLCPLLARRRYLPYLLGASAWVLGLVLFLNPIGCTFSSPSSLARQIEALELGHGKLNGWKEAGRAHAVLRGLGHGAPSLGDVRARLEHALETGEQLHPTVWSAADELELVSEAMWQSLAAQESESRKLDSLLRLPGKLNLPDCNEYQFTMLLATRSLSAQQRAHLLARVEASWPESGAHAPLAAALFCARLFDCLGAPERVEARRAQVHELLRSHWIHGNRVARFRQVGGFTPDPRQFQTSFEEATLDALLLMQRLGVPEEIDLRLVRSYLRSTSRAFPLVFEMFPYLHLDTRAGLLLVEEGLRLPPRGWLATLLGERLLIASLLIVTLCALAVRATPAPVRSRALP